MPEWISRKNFGSRTLEVARPQVPGALPVAVQFNEIGIAIGARLSGSHCTA